MKNVPEERRGNAYIECKWLWRSKSERQRFEGFRWWVANPSDWKAGQCRTHGRKHDHTHYALPETEIYVAGASNASANLLDSFA